MAVYFAGTTLLALVVNRAFFVNDAVALTVWLVFELLLISNGVLVSRR